jgi:hypothetical protein
MTTQDIALFFCPHGGTLYHQLGNRVICLLQSTARILEQLRTGGSNHTEHEVEGQASNGEIGQLSLCIFGLLYPF